MPAIHKIDLLAHDYAPLRAEALQEGHQFIETLIVEWISGKNRFAVPGEALCGSIQHGLLIAVGGLTCDPFLHRPEIGRIRRVFVRPGWRKQGLGAAMVSWLLNHARSQFECVRLRTDNPAAARLYERLGFLPIADPHATHMFNFDEKFRRIG